MQGSFSIPNWDAYVINDDSRGFNTIN